jgi:ATP-dependent Lhr-like helicase
MQVTSDSPLQGFHPAVSDWFTENFSAPTAPQRDAWPVIKARANALIAAPTGSGKTLAAFLAAIDELVWLSQQRDFFGALEDETLVVYVSPLRALSNDIQRNLEQPLEGIRAALRARGLGDAPIRTMVRTGDTPQSERERMRRKPPHILVTTPESLYLLLTSESGRAMLRTTRTVIVDEIHALAANKRGAHLALSLERLQRLCGADLVRIGLSATQKPIDEIARFLTGARDSDCRIIDTGHVRERDLALEVTASPLEAVMPGEAWDEVYERLADLVTAHSTTLIFVNTRRMTERLSRYLGERLEKRGLPADCVTSHHGSLAREHRFDAEQRLKAGQLRALVATASLELGIDIGDVDLVCQIGSPRAIGAFLQRVGRSGHAIGATPKGRLFPTTRDDLVECTALMDAVQRGELDRLHVPTHPLDVLAQQLVAEVAACEWDTDALYGLVRNAWPYRDLPRKDFDEVVQVLAEGFATRRGRRAAYLHHDAVNRRLRARRSARLTALMNGGAIPDQFDYDVVLQPQGQFVGTLNEDFAFESLPGDIFQLGNTSYRILKTEMGKVHVADAAGEPPNIPFWLGEAPGRSDELSQAVSRLREEIATRLAADGQDATIEWLVRERGIVGQAAVQVVEYLAAAHAALGALPTQDTLIFERFFDEAGDQHLVVHSSFGSRLNRAWGLSLRKRFCRKFNFELQAAALEDSIVLSLGSTHSFPLEEVKNYLKSASVRDVLTQALLAAPMFPTHWRWNANIALAVRRMRNGKRAPAQFQRMDAEDLMAVIFPDQLACAENLAGEREIPDHPLVAQTLHDCLHDVMDVDGLSELLRRIENRQVEIVTCDLAGPSPLAHEILSARPYAFLDDAPAEERRTQLVQARRFTAPEDAAALGRLDSSAIEQVRQEAWPEIRDADELHDALLLLGCVTDAELRGVPGWQRHVQELRHGGRITQVQPAVSDAGLWFATERLHIALGCYGADLQCDPPLAPLAEIPEMEIACLELVRARLQGVAIASTVELGTELGLANTAIERAMLMLEGEGVAMRGNFSDSCEQWCERGLLARIHRYTLERMRREILAVSPVDFMRFLCEWHGLAAVGDELPESQGEAALADVLTQLEGFSAPAAAWEAELLPARLHTYWPQWLDALTAAGKVQWTRLQPPGSTGKRAAPLKTTPITLLPRRALLHWRRAVAQDKSAAISSQAQSVLAALRDAGASFYDELLEYGDLLPAQLEAALAELAAAGLVTADSFAALRALLAPARRSRSGRAGSSVAEVGRWAAVPQSAPQQTGLRLPADAVECVATALLRRYGVVFRKLLEREPNLPPWRELLYVYRRLEARGEIRGGRFVDQFGGEQFAMPEAVGLLRRMRRESAQGAMYAISAADPLNLLGILLPGERVPALAGNRILYRDGHAIATLAGKKVRLLADLDQSEEWQVHNALLRRRMPMTRRRRSSVNPDSHLRH